MCVQSMCECIHVYRYMHIHTHFNQICLSLFIKNQDVKSLLTILTLNKFLLSVSIRDYKLHVDHKNALFDAYLDKPVSFQIDQRPQISVLHQTQFTTVNPAFKDIRLYSL